MHVDISTIRAVHLFNDIDFLFIFYSISSFTAAQYIAKNATDLLQQTTCEQVATNLSISSSCNKSLKLRLAATCHLQTCYNLLKQLAARM